MTVPLLQIDKLRVEFARGPARVRAVRDVDLEIFQGETLALVGESGCGKSTLGRALLRLIEPTSGNVFFLGQNIARLRGAQLRRSRADLQMIFQDPFSSLNPRRRIGDIVADPLRRSRGVGARQAAEEAGRLLDLVGLGRESANRQPHEFSGGMRQRIGIARALAPSPRFIVADEPVSALDVSIQAQVVNLLTDLTRERELTMMFISHDLGVVRHIADRVALMYLGQIIEVADRDSFFAAPAHPYGEALLSSVPQVSQTRERERIVLSGELPDPARPPSGCLFQTRCRYAIDECRTHPPELQQIAPGRSVRCHLPLISSIPIGISS